MKIVVRLAVIALIALAVPATGRESAHAVAQADANANVTVCAIGPPQGEFVDQVALSTGHARLWRLYQAFFLRQPDPDGFAYWVGVRNGGATLSEIAYSFNNSPEFQARYGNLSHAEYVDLVYDNVQCREPDSEGRAYWAALLSGGSLSRWDMMVNFGEGREYLARTGTCHSIYPVESATVGSCAEAQLSPLASATLSANGYQAMSINYGSGSIEAVKVDMRRGVFETGSSRCSVASINGNWLVPSEKDRPNPGALGIGVVDGIHVKGSSDRSDRGVFGLRFDSEPTSVVEVWPGDTLSSDDIRLNSVMHHDGLASIESWHAAAETSPYLNHLAPGEIVTASEWVWAAAGIPLRVDGQTDPHLSAAAASDAYTYLTTRHTFVAVDQNSSRLVFGGTASLNALELVGWATANGYEDLIMFDGGASTEFNVGGQAVVAGTSRDIPVWLGIGC